jgi:hypothetical protein
MQRALALLALALASRADAAVFSCDEAGVLAAIAAGGGPHTFSCGGPTTIVTTAELVISQSVELDGGGLLTLSGGGTHPVISSSASSATLRNLAVHDGRASLPAQLAGCIEVPGVLLTLENVEVTACEGGYAAILGNQGLTLVDSDVHDNPGLGIGGAYQIVITRTRVRDNLGGGIISNGQAMITDSSITGNRADSNAGVSVGNQASVTISRSTISHNVATIGAGGVGVLGFATIDDSTFVGNQPAAIHLYQWGPPQFPVEAVTIHSSTLIGNAAPSTIVVDPPPPPAPHFKEVTASITNTIVAGGIAGSVFRNGSNLFVLPECTGWTLTNAFCATKDQANLGKLGPHGGPTWTVPLWSPSVAIDAAPGCISSTDQRGVARPQSGSCDIGAFEWDPAEPAPEVPALPPGGIAALIAMLAAVARVHQLVAAARPSISVRSCSSRNPRASASATACRKRSRYSARPPG